MAIGYLQGLVLKEYYKDVQAKVKKVKRLIYKIKGQYRQYLGNRK